MSLLLRSRSCKKPGPRGVSRRRQDRMVSQGRGKNERAVARVLETVLQFPGLAEAVSLTPHLCCTLKEKAHVRKRKTKQGVCPDPTALGGDTGYLRWW